MPIVARTPPGLELESLRRAEAFCAEVIARLDAEVGPNLRAQTAFSERNG